MMSPVRHYVVIALLLVVCSAKSAFGQNSGPAPEPSLPDAIKEIFFFGSINGTHIPMVVTLKDSLEVPKEFYFGMDEMLGLFARSIINTSGYSGTSQTDHMRQVFDGDLIDRYKHFTRVNTWASLKGYKYHVEEVVEEFKTEIKGKVVTGSAKALVYSGVGVKHFLFFLPLNLFWQTLGVAGGAVGVSLAHAVTTGIKGAGFAFATAITALSLVAPTYAIASGTAASLFYSLARGANWVISKVGVRELKPPNSKSPHGPSCEGMGLL
ncbi:MAG: hypothetical protein IT289_10580 [Oligoflexia bacterium]|nr:hypothetical protein [Oligoflexia bacterium]